jgi:hypothetical protein
MARTNTNHPDLSSGIAGLKAITSSDFTSINFKVSSFQINRHDLAMIAWLYLTTHLSLINRIATLGELLFAKAGLPECHGFAAASSGLLILPWAWSLCSNRSTNRGGQEVFGHPGY